MNLDGTITYTQEYAEKDVGLGTAYERLAIYRLFNKWFDRRAIRTAFEGPLDGMAGIPGLHLLGLALRKIHVTVALPEEEALERVRAIYRLYGIEDRLTTVRCTPDALPDGSFDVVLTYNALPLVRDWRGYLDRLAARAGRYLLVSITNPSSYGVGIRKVQRLAEPKGSPELFDHESTRATVLEPILSRHGRTVQHEFLDCPWWPDLFVPTGQTLAGATLARLPLVGGVLAARRLGNGTTNGSAKEQRFLYGPQRFPLFAGAPGFDELERAMRKHPVFDGKGTLLARLFGHHHAYLVARGG